MADVSTERRRVADAQIARAEQVIEGFGLDPLGRMTLVKRQVALAKRTDDPARRLIEASAAVDGAVTAAGLPGFADELSEQAKEYLRIFAGAPWDRLYEAAARGASDPLVVEQLGTEIGALLSLDNLKALAVILGAWVVATIVGGPVAWIVNAGLTLAGVVAIGNDIVKAAKSAGAYATTAYHAKTEAEIDLAGHYFAQALVEAGTGLLTLAFSTAAFRATRAAVLQSSLRFRAVRAPRLGERVPERAPPERAPQERVPTEEQPRRRPRTNDEPTRPREERVPEEAERAPKERDPWRELAEDAARGRGAKEAADNLGTILAVGGGGLLLALLIAGLVLAARRPRRGGRTDA